MKEPVDHILRPRLPWRSPDGPALTECGYNAASLKTITREEYIARVRDMGKQRAAMVTCMTCSQTASRWKTWEQDPREALGREVEWEAAWRKDRGDALLNELTAIAALIEAHKDEFAELISRQKAKYDWLQKKAAKAVKP